MRIFFDTEFSGLNSDPRLLSIGLVADDGSELYIEFADGWTEEKCSSWVREHVLPMLGNGERMSRNEAARRIWSWLATLGEEPSVMGETDWDTTLLANLMEENGFARDCLRLEILNNASRSQAKSFEEAKQRFFHANGLTPHHALTDTRAFYSAWYVTLGAASS